MLVIALAAAGLLFVVATSAGLPEIAATRFGLGGEPNAFMTRASYRASMSLLVFLLPVVVAFLPRLIGERRPQWLNIPDRAYWMSSERRADTLASLQARMGALAAALIFFVSAVHWLIMRANARVPPRLDEGLLLVLIGTFVAFLVAWIAAFYARFRR